MLTQHGMLRHCVAGLACLITTAAVAQERTADYTGQANPNAGQVRPVIHWGNGGYVQNNYYNPWANYAPGYNTYPIARDPNRGYVAYSHTGGHCCSWMSGWSNCKNNSAACRAEFGQRFRCSMSFLKPLTYWDVGSQCDIIAVNPGYANPADLGPAYAAQGFGGPVTVPLAPNVRSQYNYGWGIPSSRLTPIMYPAAR
ncbi:MAG: hypothetical protein JWM11_4708 [Planctomycetaceae bacterium]|nr:hypothetical protein [Planctomycetaceae bacterium]